MLNAVALSRCRAVALSCCRTVTPVPRCRAVNTGYSATARNTGQGAAEQALNKIAGNDSQLTAITLTAKEKTCFNPDVPCDPDVCDYARGYYDRLPNARKDLMANGINDRGAVECIARMHEVCPFE